MIVTNALGTEYDTRELSSDEELVLRGAIAVAKANADGHTGYTKIEIDGMKLELKQFPDGPSWTCPVLAQIKNYYQVRRNAFAKVVIK